MCDHANQKGWAVRSLLFSVTQHSAVASWRQILGSLRKVMGDWQSTGGSACEAAECRSAQRTEAKQSPTFVLEGTKGIRGRVNEISVDYSRCLTSRIGSKVGGGARWLIFCLSIECLVRCPCRDGSIQSVFQCSKAPSWEQSEASSNSWQSDLSYSCLSRSLASMTTLASGA